MNLAEIRESIPASLREFSLERQPARFSDTPAFSRSVTSVLRMEWNIHRHVRRLQARIVKATQIGRHNKAKALQWLLTRSFSGKALAVKRVTEKYSSVTGCRKMP